MTPLSLSRRTFLKFAGVSGASSLCTTLSVTSASAANELRLQQRPRTPRETLPSGEHRLGLGGQRDGLLYVPKSSAVGAPAPLLVMLHGAGNRAQAMTYTFPLADEFGLVVLAPDSRGPTWDAISNAVAARVAPNPGDTRSPRTALTDNPDVRFIDEALGWVFDRCAIDATRIAVGGFSDGASYALTLGLSNGDLFNAVVAFSPGFIPTVAPLGKPRIFVSHGTGDTVLPIDRAGRPIVRRLNDDRYDVTYVEFDGGHTVPPPIAREGFTWLLRR